MHKNFYFSLTIVYFSSRLWRRESVQHRHRFRNALRPENWYFLCTENINNSVYLATTVFSSLSGLWSPKRNTAGSSDDSFLRRCRGPHIGVRSSPRSSLIGLVYIHSVLARLRILARHLLPRVHRPGDDEFLGAR